MNLFEIYDAAIENAKINELTFDAKAVQDYADVVFDEYVSDENAAIIMEAHNAWESSEKGSHNYYVLVQSALEAIEI